MRDHNAHITVHNFANLGPVVNYINLDDSNEKLLSMYSPINTPAIGAAFVVKAHQAKNNKQISLQFGDLISVIEKSDPDWWRGKKQYEVGFFPSNCVELIGSDALNSQSEHLEQLIKKHYTGSLRFKQSSSSNNENENLLVNLLKCKQLEDEENSTHTHSELEENEQYSSNQSSCNHEENCMTNNRNDKKPLNEWTTNSLNSMNIKQNCSTPKTRNLRTILPLNTNNKQTDHHTVQNHSFLKSSSSSNSTSNSAFQRRISSTLPKSLTVINNKPSCTNLFDEQNLNSRSFDTPDNNQSTSFLSNKSIDLSNNLSNLQSSSSNNLISSPISNYSNSVNKTASSSNQMMGNNTVTNKRSGKLSSFFRSIINRNTLNESQFDKHGSLKRQEKSNVLTNLRNKNKKLSINPKNTIFGCELNAYLNRTNRKIPLVLESCCEFLEQNGIIHGVYRLSGVNSNLQKLIKCFDLDEKPNFNDDIFLQDIHCVSSLLKFYFRELPNPLLTFELYDDFVKAIQPSFDLTGQSCTPPEEIPEKMKLANLIKVLRMLPLNHYVTLEYLIKHLNKIASHADQTGMTVKNLAIVWSPNLLRSKELEQQANISALQCIAIQAVLTEYLIRHVNELFTDESRPFNYVDHFNSQEDYLNNSSLIDHISNQQTNHSQDNDLLEQFNLSKSYENQLELYENHFEDNQISDLENSIENKYVKPDKKFLELPEARARMKKKIADSGDKPLEELLGTGLKDECQSKSSENFFNEPFLNFDNQISNHNETNENEFHSNENDQRTFGVLGEFNSSNCNRKKRFGNLDLIDEIDQDESIDSTKTNGIRKRRSLFENEDDERFEESIKFNIDRFRYKTFDEQSDDDSPLKSKNKIDQIDNDLRLESTPSMLNTKNFYKTNTSTPKEGSSSSSNIFKRTPNKWKPSIKL